MKWANIKKIILQKIRKILSNPKIVIPLALLLSIFVNLFCLNKNAPTLVSDQYLISFIGVILGLSITIITFFHSSVGKLCDLIDKVYENSEADRHKLRKKLKESCGELRDDTRFIFITYMILMFTIFFEKINIPGLVWPPILISKVAVVSVIKLFLTFVILRAVIDCFFSLIGILKISTIFLDKE